MTPLIFLWEVPPGSRRNPDVSCQTTLLQLNCQSYLALRNLGGKTLISRSKEDLGKLLIEEQLITSRQLEKAASQAERTGEPLQKLLISLGFVTEKDVVEAMGRQMGVRFVDLESMTLDPELARLIPEHLAQRYKVIPVGQNDNRLTLAMVDPLNVIALDDIRLITGFDIDPVIATDDSITKALNGQFGVTAIAEVEGTVKDISATDFGPMDFEDGAEEEVSLDKLKEMVDEAPIVRVVNLIISQAINDKASDIHIEPEAKAVKVRYRVDGVLHEVMSPPKHIQAPMTSRIKIMAAMDIAERRVPQDGKIHLTHDGREYDLRVSTVP